MQTLRTELRVRAQVVAVEESERTGDGRSAGEAGERDHSISAVVDGLRRRRASFVRGEILAGQDASERADIVGDGGGELALVQDLRAAARDRFQRSRELGLQQTVRRLEARRRA